MSVRCWNCGQDIEAGDPANVDDVRRRVVQGLLVEAEKSHAAGSPARAAMLMSAASVVEGMSVQ